MKAARVLAFRRKAKPRRPGVWQEVGRPIFAGDNTLISRAQSLLTGELIGGVCPPLSTQQARDVLAWAGIHPPAVAGSSLEST